MKGAKRDGIVRNMLNLLSLHYLQPKFIPQCLDAVDWCDEQEDSSAKCLGQNQMCDGNADCIDGYDESSFVCVGCYWTVYE